MLLNYMVTSSPSLWSNRKHIKRCNSPQVTYSANKLSCVHISNEVTNSCKYYCSRANLKAD